MGWIFLLLTVASEVTGTTMMKLSKGYTVLLPTVLSFVFYLGTLGFMTMTLKHLGIGLTYAVWSGLGIVVVTIIGYLFFNEAISFQKVLYILFILLGVIGLKLSSS